MCRHWYRPYRRPLALRPRARPGAFLGGKFSLTWMLSIDLHTQNPQQTGAVHRTGPGAQHQPVVRGTYGRDTCAFESHD